eukprot:768678-Hanusia_phi.AAC.2
MSGGFYGLSRPLAQDIMLLRSVPRIGYEDLLVGQWVREISKNCNVHVINWANGLYWCHGVNRAWDVPDVLNSFDCRK